MFAKKMSRNYKKFKAVVIGAGRIAALFDKPGSRTVLTHAHAFQRNPRIELVGFYDIDFDKAHVAAERWSTRAFKNFEQLYAAVQPDIVSICTPNSHHYSTLVQVAELKPRLVITEKPLTTNLVDSKKIINLYQKKKIPVLVNYSRRFDSSVQKLKTELHSGRYGQVLGATGVYSKGVLHNGSHLIDLTRYLFGEVIGAKALFGRSDYQDPADSAVGGFLSFDHCQQFYLVAADERCYSIFELDILCERGRIRFTDSGLVVTEEQPIFDPLYKGYTILGKAKCQPTHLAGALVALVDNAVHYLEKKQPLLSTLANAYETQRVCSILLTQSKKIKYV